VRKASRLRSESQCLSLFGVKSDDLAVDLQFRQRNIEIAFRRRCRRTGRHHDAAQRLENVSRMRVSRCNLYQQFFRALVI
jgi:hypothetical protein